MIFPARNLHLFRGFSMAMSVITRWQTAYSTEDLHQTSRLRSIPSPSASAPRVRRKRCGGWWNVDERTFSGSCWMTLGQISDFRFQAVFRMKPVRDPKQSWGGEVDVPQLHTVQATVSSSYGTVTDLFVDRQAKTFYMEDFSQHLQTRTTFYENPRGTFSHAPMQSILMLMRGSLEDFHRISTRSHTKP